MHIQMAFIVAIIICAVLAVPFFYNHRMNDGVFTGGVLTFIGVPLLAGVLQKQTQRSVARVAIIMLVLCPVVYAVTDPLAVQFEKLRDGYFLATSSSIVFVSAVWLTRSFKSGRFAQAVITALGLLSGAVAVVILLWMVMYVE